MALPEIEKRRVVKLLDAFCAQRVPAQFRDEIRLSYKVTGNKVVLVESRPRFDDPALWTEMPIAQFEYDADNKMWSLFAYDRNDRRRPYSKGFLEKLLGEVDTDPTGIFWG